MKKTNSKLKMNNAKGWQVLCLLGFLIFNFTFLIGASAQEVVPGYTNRLVFTTTNGAAYFQSRLLWTTNAIAIPSNTIPWATNTTWGYGGGLMTWGVTGGTNYLFNSIGTNLWGRVAISTNF